MRKKLIEKSDYLPIKRKMLTLQMNKQYRYIYK